MAVHVPEKLVFLSHPRTYGIEIEAALLRIYARGRAFNPDIDIIPKEKEVYCSVRNPYSLVLEWFDVNPGWQERGLYRFIMEYNHSHFTRKVNNEESLFWYYSNDNVNIIRDETIHEQISQLIDEPVDFLLTPILNYKDRYDPETVVAVKNRFQYDLDRLNYKF